ncbi:hypothetical protein F5Y18DRAFT_393584 [Xylariaceae sp. FL1019]|nr:hypothetical protein F5Y18DRAFT_393584 [Xylariaceae sp. FL1019]
MIGPKPGKLRAACNQCAASKVKCSGEKTGCSSCANRGIECVFAESRVGRVPGMRGKRKLTHPDARSMGNTRGAVLAEPTPLSPRTPDDLHAGDAIDLDCTSASTPGSLVPDTDHMGLFDDTLLGWSTVSNTGLDERSTDDIFGTLRDAPTDLSWQQQMSRINQSGCNRTSVPSLSYTANTLNSTGIEPGYQAPRPQDSPYSLRRSSPPTPPNQMGVVDSERNNQCVIACSQIIFSLEKYQVDKLKVLNLILGIVKGVTKRLDPLVNGQFEGHSTKCLALFDIIIYQLVEMLEAGCADFLAETPEVPGPFPMDLMEPGFHEVDMSGFGMCLKDQERFRSQNILEVLRPLIRIMQKVLFISTNAGFQGDSVAREGQGRLKTLEEKVKTRADGAGVVISPESRGNRSL